MAKNLWATAVLLFLIKLLIDVTSDKYMDRVNRIMYEGIKESYQKGYDDAVGETTAKS